MVEGEHKGAEGVLLPRCSSLLPPTPSTAALVLSGTETVILNPKFGVYVYEIALLGGN